MKKSSIVKASLCGGVALAIVATVNMPRVSSASLNAEKGLAGISITLDKYCTTEPQEAVTAEPTEVAVNEDAIASEAVVNEGSQYDDVAISIAILIVTILIIAKVAIKIYSNAILNYGTKMSFKDIIKMYNDKQN